MRRYLFPLLRIVFGALFIAASVDKIINPEAFARIIVNYRLVPDALAAPAALVMPWVEVTAGVALMLNRLPRGAIALLNAMLIVFMAALGFNVIRGVDVACGCFTTDTEGSGMLESLLRDIPLLLAGLYLAWRIFSQRKSKNQPRRGRQA